MYKIVYTKKAAADIQKLKAANLDKKAKALIDVKRDNPYQTPPRYEKLIGDFQGAYSRRINIRQLKSSACGLIMNSDIWKTYSN